MKIITHINDEHFEIEIARDPERETMFTATIDGRPVELMVIERKPGSITLAIDGQVGFYEFHEDKGRIVEAVHDCKSFRASLRNPQQDQLEKLLEQFGAGAGGMATDTKVVAQMPGKILGINVKIGEKIGLGQVICVLEAMKMENEIPSTVEGKVKQINMKVGESVAAGDILLEIDAPR